MFRRYVFVSMVNPSPPADVIMGGQGRKIGTRERRKKRRGSFGVRKGYSEAACASTAQDKRCQNGKEERKEDYSASTGQACSQRWGKCYWVNVVE